MLTDVGTLQFLRMFAIETRLVSFANWLRLKIPFSTKDKIFATGIFFGAMEKLKPFLRAVISTRPKVRCDTLTTHFSLSTMGGLLLRFLLLISLLNFFHVFAKPSLK